MLDHFFLHSHVGSTTFTKFKSEPLDVLDLGCGAGTWIIDTAKCARGRCIAPPTDTSSNSKILDPDPLCRIRRQYGPASEPESIAASRSQGTHTLAAGRLVRVWTRAVMAPWAQLSFSSVCNGCPSQTNPSTSCAAPRSAWPSPRPRCVICRRRQNATHRCQQWQALLSVRLHNHHHYLSD